ncbi:hypothetical protein KM043_006419 [Ampulex compressa]|nr:hypothetical protein KM043_006419 [Ampulex compressa]
MKARDWAVFAKREEIEEGRGGEGKKIARTGSRLVFPSFSFSFSFHLLSKIHCGNQIAIQFAARDVGSLVTPFDKTEIDKNPGRWRRGEPGGRLFGKGKRMDVFFTN